MSVPKPVKQKSYLIYFTVSLCNLVPRVLSPLPALPPTLAAKRPWYRLVTCHCEVFGTMGGDEDHNYLYSLRLTCNNLLQSNVRLYFSLVMEVQYQALFYYIHCMLRIELLGKYIFLVGKS